jgi:esterase/lipase
MKDILLLHGAIGAKDQLQPLADALKDRYIVHTLNFSGHGGEAFAKEDISIPMQIRSDKRSLHLLIN